MKRLFVVATLALIASAGLATSTFASGAFGLFYCPKYCSSYCQQCCPHNAFSSNGCLMGCCPPPVWPYSGYGCGGCGAYGACGYNGYHGHHGHKGWKGQGCGVPDFGFAPAPDCGPIGGPACGPCCRNKAPHAMHLVQSSPQHFDPICCQCGMDSYGLGGLRGTGFGYHCKGGSCRGGAGGGQGWCGDRYPGPMGPIGHPMGPVHSGMYGFEFMPYGYGEPALAYGEPMIDSYAPRNLAQYWTANQNANPAMNVMQPVSNFGYYPATQMMPNWGYGYGQYPNYYPTYNPASWTAYGYPQGW